MTKITISLIKADVGGYPGHSAVHPALIETAEYKLEQARKAGAEVTVEPKNVDIPSRPAVAPVRIAFCKGPDGEIIEFFQNR